MKKFFQIIGILFSFIVVVGLAWATFLYFKNKDRFQVSSVSMLPNLLVADVLSVDKHAYDEQAPERGQIIVFKSLDDEKFVLIGRIVGISGDEVSFEAGKLFVNGNPASREPGRTVQVDGESFEETSETLGSRTYPVWYLQTTNPTTFSATKVASDKVFVVGDNRDQAMDSRRYGAIPRANIIGQAKKIAESDTPGRAGKEL